MVERRLLHLGILAWAVVGLAVAVPSLTRVSPDARLVIGFASVAFPACAVLASMALTHGRDRLAGALLLVSVATPTYFAWVVNVPALLIGLALLVVPSLLVQGSPRGSHLQV